MRNKMMQPMLAACIVLCLNGCNSSATGNVALCEVNCKEAPASICTGDCKEAPMDLKLPTGWHGLKLDPSEQQSLNKAVTGSPNNHVDIGVQGGKLTFQSDPNQDHAPSGSGKIAVQNTPDEKPKEVTVVPTPAAAAAMHQRLAGGQIP